MEDTKKNMSIENRVGDNLKRRWPDKVLDVVPKRLVKIAAVGLVVLGAGKVSAKAERIQPGPRPGEPGLLKPELQKVSDFFPVYTVNLGNKDKYGIKDINDLSNIESDAYKNVAEDESYKKFIEKAFVFADIATKIGKKEFNVRPAFAITPDNKLFLSGLLLHQNEEGNADEFFLFGQEGDATPIMQKLTLSKDQTGKIDIQIRPLKLGDETIMVPTINNIKTGDALGFIGNPMKDGIKSTPAPQNNAGIQEIKLVSYTVDKDNKPEVEGATNGAALDMRLPTWNDQSKVDSTIISMKKGINEMDKNPKFVVDASVAGYPPVIVDINKKTTDQSGHTLTITEFSLNGQYLVDDPSGVRIGSEEALAKQVRLFMETAADKNGKVSFPQNVGGGKLEQRSVSKDAPVVIRWGSFRNDKTLFKYGGQAAKGGIFYTFEALPDGSLLIYLENGFKNDDQLKLSNERDAAWLATSINDAFLKLCQGNSNMSTQEIVKKAEAKGLKAWGWITMGKDGGDPTYASIFSLQSTFK